MNRCRRTTYLEVHHVSRNGGNRLGNAKVLCHTCHVETPSYGEPGESPPVFTEETRIMALVIAGKRCQCTRTASCH